MDKHISVLLDESVQHLNIKPKGVYVDLTLGEAGHTKKILQTDSTCFVYGVDRDQRAIDFSSKVLKDFAGRFALLKSDFASFRSVLALQKVAKVDGILLDLGVSTVQVLSAERGFSYTYEGDLDMRMDTSLEVTAKQVVNSFSVEDLKRIFYEFGDEKKAGYYAKLIEKARPLHTTLDLAKIIGLHNKKSLSRVFQAIRIYVNRELEQISQVIPKAIGALKPGGRLVVISYHSKEDRIVKKAFKEFSQNCQCPQGLPECICGFSPKLKIITKKPICPSQEEIDSNKRSRSAKLRVAERR